MPIEPADLTALDPAVVATSLAEVVQLVSEANPTLDMKRGPVHDIVLYYGSLLNAQSREMLARYLSAMSLTQIQADPTLADLGIVDGVLSNWGISRGAGSSATGSVTIVLSGSVSVTISVGTVFTSGGNQYTANLAYTAKPEASQINDPSDRLMTQLSDGTWAFTIDVTASTAGSAALIKKDALLIPSALPTNYITSYATDNFTGGLDPETNSQLIARLAQGISAQATSNRVNMAAMLRNNAAFTQAKSSIIGFGDVEMLRDQHTIWPGSVGGGRVDWYVRTQSDLASITLTKTATLLSISQAGVGLWQTSILRDDAPGFYEITSIRQPTATGFGTLTLVSDTRGLDLTGPAFVPDIATVAEGAYSYYQTSVITFNDVATGLTVGAAATYQVTVSCLPQISNIQAFVGSFDNRGVGSDVLVKAPVPCFVSISLSISKKNTQADPDTSAIQNAIADAVNAVDFTGRLFASTLQDAIAALLLPGMSASAINMLGRLRVADGTVRYFQSKNVLIIPSLVGTQASPRTTQFFASATDVAVDIRSDIIVPV
jgi:uncharacterized phage protein gp47/JayE